jgi:hypothetical protein
MKILLVGQSQHFLEVVNKNFPDANIEVVAWRSLKIKSFGSSCEGHFDLVFIAGYDYSSYRIFYRDYYKSNVESVYDFVCGLSFSKCVYIDTLTSRFTTTYSRYYFAKKCLRNLLIKKYATSYNFHVHELPTLTHNGSICMNAGFIDKLLARILVLIGVLKTRHLDDCIHDIVKSISSKNIDISSFVEIQPKLLFIPRTRLIDRLLRVVHG